MQRRGMHAYLFVRLLEMGGRVGGASSSAASHRCIAIGWAENRSHEDTRREHNLLSQDFWVGTYYMYTHYMYTYYMYTYYRYTHYMYTY